jgi:hypothetical protein
MFLLASCQPLKKKQDPEPNRIRKPVERIRKSESATKYHESTTLKKKYYLVHAFLSWKVQLLQLGKNGIFLVWVRAGEGVRDFVINFFLLCVALVD